MDISEIDPRNEFLWAGMIGDNKNIDAILCALGARTVGDVAGISEDCLRQNRLVDDEIMVIRCFVRSRLGSILEVAPELPDITRIEPRVLTAARN